MSVRVLAAAVVLMAAGCGQDMNTGLDPRPPDAEQLVKANDVTRVYLRAAAEGDAERLCAMRTKGAVRDLGRHAACLRKSKSVRVYHGRKLAPAQLRAAEVLEADTGGRGITARVMVDYGEAYIESGHATGGKVLLVDLRLEDGRYRVSSIGAAAFAD